MKNKINLIFALALFFSTNIYVNAQDIILTDESENNVTNGEMYLEGPASYDIMKAKIFFTNNMEEDAHVLVRRVEVDVLPGTINYFCWKDACLDETTFEVDDPIILTPGETSTASDFYADYLPEGQEGTSIVRYEFFSDRDDFETSHVTVHYITESTTNISYNDDESRDFLVSVHPNPAIDFVDINHSESSSANEAFVRLYSITGSLLKEEMLSPGSTSYRMDLSSVPRGIYMLSLHIDGRLISTRKLVVNR